ncbi:MAG TPA: hypothetical protein VJL29_03255 [Thermoguttaceae bacterium]|nr:hypothetical protein [Thermoguttaceae bacterium]
MSSRSLSVALMIFVVLAGVTALQAQTHDYSTCGPEPACQTECGPQPQAAPVATWWANSSLGKFYRACARDAKRNNCWPEPFVKADRLAVRAPFVQMVSNGWERQNTLGDHHFDRETGKLNRDGQLKIRRILLEGLPQHRALYVYRAERQAETLARVDSAQQYAAQTVRDGVLPPIYETDIPAVGWPAQLVDRVDGQWVKTMPDPRLPAKQQSEEDSQ